MSLDKQICRRIIARLDMKMEWLIKGVQMEGWRKIGDPGERAIQYYQDGADELLYMDVVASLYERNNLTNTIRDAAERVFIPITVGGGVASLAAAKELLAVGADKVAINTAVTQDPTLITRLSDTYGSQATVLSIEAKSLPQGGWEVMTDNGRNHTHLDAVAWAAKCAALGAGEILVTSIDKDGTRKGLDLNLIKAISGEVDIPVIACGGIGSEQDCVTAFETAPKLSAVAMASALHYDKATVKSVRAALVAKGFNVRQDIMEGAQ
jgi:imidazole glycerol-phosphate synthase subunit HisF